MKRLLFCVLLAIVSSASLITAQNPAQVPTQDPNAALASLPDLSQRGQLLQVIQTANSLLASNKLSPSDQGMAFIYLGYAYQQRGEFTQATASYEKALAVVNSDGQHQSDYAATLSTLATVYAQIGQADTAKHILLRAIHLFENDGDHAGAAMIWNDLANIAAERNSHREAHKDMERSIAESQLAHDMSLGEFAALATTQARIAELDGDPHTAISNYQHALDLWKQTNRDQQQRTAWLNVLLGGAYLQAGDIPNAREATTRGLSMLEASSGRDTPRYHLAELTYSKILDASGAHDQASTLRKQAQSSLDTSTDLQRAKSQISINALR